MMLLKCENLNVWFPVYGGRFFQRQVGNIKAVDGITFEIARGTTFALVGESGCGKTTLARTILGLEKTTSGIIYYKGQRISYKVAGWKELRKKIQTVFQDPYLSLNPRTSIKDIVAEGIDIHRLASSAKEREEKVAKLLSLVEVNPDAMERFPQQFSAGQRQRIAIARALAVEPEFIILDEPVSSLDVSVQSKILNLLKNLQQKLGLTYLFISHDLAVVKNFSDRVAVMYLGKIVEEGPAKDIYESTLHSYTKALLAAVPIPDPRCARERERIEISEEVPSAEHIPSGCRFHTRCPIRELPLCKKYEPEFTESEENHFVACHKVRISNHEA